MAERCLLYYITDRNSFPGDESSRRKRLLQKVSEAALAGIDYIQLRERDLCTRDLQSLAIEAATVLKQLKSEYPQLRTALLINSRTDVALAGAADGVHLRSDDISPNEVRIIWENCGAGAACVSPGQPLIGVSCYSPEGINRAEANGATFAVFAPVFEKKNAPSVAPKGLSLLREACKSKLPVLALGGVTPANARACIEAGAAGVAGIRLFQENDISEIAPGLRHPL